MRKISVVYLAVAACALALSFALRAGLDTRALSGGELTTPLADANAYAVPAPPLSAEQTQHFALGREAFDQRWVVAPQLGGPWGLGPTSNGNKCTACHENNGRGHAPEKSGQALRSLLVRLSVAGENEYGGPQPHPDYGDQLNDIGVPDQVPNEGRAAINYTELEVAFADGEKITLRAPRIEFEQLKFGPLAPGTLTSARLAPPLIGLGLLEAIPEETLLAIAKQQAALGISGRPNYVWDVLASKEVIGRFGLKANQPSIRQQVAAAFHGDLGVTSEYFPAENCPAVQKDCRVLPPGGFPELSARNIDAIQFYLRALAVPARRNLDDPGVQRGEQLFAQAQCAACHVPQLKTGAYPALPIAANQVIRPYTDLLLHDMGEELADHRPDFKADGREWRTAPLWGLGLSAQVNGNASLLHDGRARNVAEAILWHGGEAAAASTAFRAMPKEDRRALIRFVETI
jgi:CxxC motif-containing protein (DUF1111 family)